MNASTYSLLGGERTFAHTGGVGLDNAKDSADLVGTDAETGANTADGGGGRSHVGIGAEVNVEHGSVGAFDEDLLALLDGHVNLVHGIADHGKEIGKHGLNLGQFAFEVIIGEVVADTIL